MEYVYGISLWNTCLECGYRCQAGSVNFKMHTDGLLDYEKN